jgi:stage II sporulation protein M
MFLIGLTAGSFAAKFMTDEQGLNLTDYIVNKLYTSGEYETQDTSGTERLCEYAANDFKTYAVTAVFALTILAVPYCMIICAYKGFIIGFTSGFLIKATSSKGVLFILLAIMPQNTIRIILLIFCCVFVIKYALQKKEFSPENKKRNAYKLIVIILLTAGANISTNLIEAYITPQLMKLFSLYLI